MAEKYRPLATLPWVSISNNPDLVLEDSAVFKNVKFCSDDEKNEHLTIFKNFNKMFPFYIPMEHHQMDVEKMVMSSPNGQYWAVAIYFLISCTGHSPNVWEIFQEHLDGRKNSNDSPSIPAPFISDHMMSVLFPDGVPPQCENASEFMIDPWVLMQLQFEPVLFHQWLVAFFAEISKVSMELLELHFFPLYQQNCKVSTYIKHFFEWMSSSWKFVSQGFSFLQTYAELNHAAINSDFPNLAFAYNVAELCLKKNFNLKDLIRSFKKFVWINSPIEPSKEKNDPPEEQYNIYNLKFWRDSTWKGRKIFYNPVKEGAQPSEEENDELVLRIDELLETIQAHCNHNLEFTDKLKNFLANDEIFKRTISDLRKIEDNSSLLRIRKEELGVIGTVMTIALYSRMNDAANRAKSRIREVTGVNPSLLLRFNYVDIPPFSNDSFIEIEKTLGCSERNTSEYLNMHLEGTLEKELHASSEDCPNYTENPLDIAKKFEVRIKRLVFEKIEKIKSHRDKTLKMHRESESDNVPSVADWQFAQYLLPCFVASMLELFTRTNDKEPAISKEMKEWYVNLVHELVSAYENPIKEAALEQNIEDSYLSLYLKKRFSFSTLLEVFYKSTINDFIVAVSMDESFERHFLHLRLLFEGLKTSDECTLSAEDSLQTNYHFDLMSFNFFLKLQNAMHSCPRANCNKIEDRSIVVSNMNNLIKVMCHFGFLNPNPAVHPNLPTSSILLLALIECCLRKNKDLTIIKKIKRMKHPNNSLDDLLKAAREECENLSVAQTQSLAFYLAMSVIPRDEFSTLSKKIATKSVLDQALCSYVKDGKMWDLRHFLNITPHDELKVSHVFAKEKAPVLYYVAMNELNKDCTKVKLNSPGEAWFFPITHCRYCGLLNIDVNEYPCTKCIRCKQYPDKNFFCSAGCRKNAMNTYHDNEHVEYDTHVTENLYKM
ncbi:Hypothetical predicted protein [Cloeon dipterum]|uniref:Uncharacterized protein n=1 Tax=Cloeon dipterum TaxID=197152 RepID=A0A8S1C0W8_9INSE|nr:Hypothetical predicted protein [Cloeon dipterum]